MIRNITRQTLGQLTEEPKEIVKEAVSQVTTPEEEGVEQPGQPAGPQKTPAQKAQDEKETKRRLADLEQEMAFLREKRERQLKERREVPAEEKKTQQIEMVQRKKESPVVAAAKQRASIERRIKGVSG